MRIRVVLYSNEQNSRKLAVEVVIRCKEAAHTFLMSLNPIAVMRLMKALTSSNLEVTSAIFSLPLE